MNEVNEVNEVNEHGVNEVDEHGVSGVNGVSGVSGVSGVIGVSGVNGRSASVHEVVNRHHYPLTGMPPYDICNQQCAEKIVKFTTPLITQPGVIVEFVIRDEGIEAACRTPAHRRGVKLDANPGRKNILNLRCECPLQPMGVVGWSMQEYKTDAAAVSVLRTVFKSLDVAIRDCPDSNYFIFRRYDKGKKFIDEITLCSPKNGQAPRGCELCQTSCQTLCQTLCQTP